MNMYLMKLKKLLKNMKKKKPKYITVKFYYTDTEIDFLTGETISPTIEERYEKLKIVHTDSFGLVYAERDGQLYVFNPNDNNVVIEYED